MMYRKCMFGRAASTAIEDHHAMVVATLPIMGKVMSWSASM